ncbi:DUF445 domain-containing protein [Pelosinus sp. sgz500959]|uniref:DUF445 domain-containing protein n=1 Tax=Pelosinus sp. sgz500959 TaxID=3242472 RepID=UPI00366BADB8
MIENRYKATFILVLVSVGFFISYPFQHTLMGGFFASGFRAAMIGGLADWFAVSALFHRPLGIPFRTAIIPRNREKIFSALVYMVEHEILMKENIKKRLNEYDLSLILLYFVDIQRSRQDLKKMIYRFLQDFLLQIKNDELEKIIENIVEEHVQNIKILPCVTYMSQWLFRHGYDEKMLDVIIQQCIIVIENKNFVGLLEEVFIAVQEKYERGMNRRKLFNRLMDLSPKQLASGVQHGLISTLSEMKTSDHPIRREGKKRLEQFILKLQNDVSSQQIIESYIQKNIISKFKLGKHLAQIIMTIYRKSTVDNRIVVRGMESLVTQFDILVTDFTANQEERKKVDIYLKSVVNEWVDDHHDEIGRIVKDSLNGFTNERLVNFIEDKLGNDLQMIRINGSVVGGFVGIIIHILTFWL